MDDLAYLPLVLTQVFDGRPTGYLAKSVGPQTANVLEQAWISMKSDYRDNTEKKKHGDSILAWLPGTAKDTFKDYGRHTLGNVYVPSNRSHIVCDNDGEDNGKATTDDPCSEYIQALWKISGACERDRRSSLPKSHSRERKYSSKDFGLTGSHNMLHTKETSKSTSQNAVAKSLKRRATAQTSQFWSPVKKSAKSSSPSVSAVPFPSLESNSYGLIQEELAHNPFNMLVAVIFLVKTKGEAAIPTLQRILKMYPTPHDFAALSTEDLFPDIKHLGLANRRAEAIIELANAWIQSPPEKHKRWRRLHYPRREDGKNILREEQPLHDSDPRSAFEICHLPHMGAYAIDSWRIFCRDELRGVPTGIIAKPVIVQEMTGENADAIEQELQQEWVNVHPSDKELVGYIKWRWLRLGWVWNELTGERQEIGKKALRKMEDKLVRRRRRQLNNQ